MTFSPALQDASIFNRGATWNYFLLAMGSTRYPSSIAPDDPFQMIGRDGEYRTGLGILWTGNSMDTEPLKELPVRGPKLFWDLDDVVAGERLDHRDRTLLTA